jgi:hypothetical protein
MQQKYNAYRSNTIIKRKRYQQQKIQIVDNPQVKEKTSYHSKLLFIKKYCYENINFSAALKIQNQKLINNTIQSLM